MYTCYMMYQIWFTDFAEYTAALALTGGGGFQHCPFLAAQTFGITWPLVGGGPMTGTKGIYYYPPFTDGAEFTHPGPSGIYVDATIDSFIIPGQASSLFPAGPSGNFVWYGACSYTAIDVAGVPAATPIPQRRWIVGYETSGNQSENSVNYAAGGSRLASRTIEGFGLAIRGSNSSGTVVRAVNTFRAGLTPRTSWERFYIRVHALGTNRLQVWWCVGSVFAEGAGISINNSTGRLEVLNGKSSAITLIATSSFALTLDVWYLIDVLLEFPAIAANSGRVRVFINHVLDIDVSDNTGLGIDRVATHVSSEFGQQSTAEANWEVDLDDWMCADVPNNVGTESLDSIDWTYGTHIRSTWIDSGTLTGWSGHILMTNQFLQPNQVDASSMGSSTALATIEALTNYDDEADIPGAILGPVSFWIGSFAISTINQTGRIGYSILSGAYVYANILDSNSNKWLGNYYNPAIGALPTSIAPLSIIKEKANNANAMTTYSLFAEVEYVGVWGLEDDTLFPLDLSNNINLLLHNAIYYNTVYALPPDAGAPTAPCYAIGGTYTGNGTATTINLPSLAHMIWIRALSGAGNAGCKWFEAGFGGNDGILSQVYANDVVRCWVDATGQPKFTVTGSGEVNVSGIIYQYIVFCDPGARFNQCSAFNRADAITTTDIPFFDTNFLPEAGFVQRQIMNSSGIGTNTLAYKGVGHTGDTGSLLSGVPITNCGSFAAGVFTAKADVITETTCGTNVSLWKTTDYDGYIMVQITSYIGDGTGFKVVNLPLTTGRYPLLAIVCPHNSTVAFMRDPSHTGNNSCSVQALVNSVTAIVGGGIDQIFVGTTINTNLIVYDVFVLMGDSAGWNNGIFSPPNVLTAGPWVPPPFGPSGEPIIVMDGGMDFNGAAGLLNVKDLSGIYTLITNKLVDTIYDRQTGQTSVDIEIPDPTFKTGYIGG